MKTQAKLLNETLISQLNAYCLHVDLSYNIIDILGCSECLGFQKASLYANVFDNLPKPVSESLLENIQKNLRTNSTEKAEVTYVDKNNLQKKVKIITNIIDSEDQVFYLVTFIVLPLTTDENTRINNGYESYEEARRQLEFSENRYNSFFENDPVMHFSVNPATGLIADCNKFSVKKLGIGNKEEIIGEPIYTIFTDEKRERCLSLLEKFKQEGYLDSEEMEMKTKSGGTIPVILYTTAQRDENGKVLLSRSTLVDISDLKNAQKRLIQKRIRLENMNMELEQFVSTCSHDLQEPLATIKFANDLIGKLYKDKLDAQGQSYVRYVDEAVDRLTSQIRSLLSHIRLGQNAERTKVDTNELLKTVTKDLGKSISSSRAQIKISDSLPVIKAYRVELRLLFQNLISNAIKYRKKGRTPKIEISATRDKNYTYFSIKDNGIGVSEIDQKEIFKIFNRVNENSPHKGDGVGLAHCEKIVRMHEGDISIQSELGVGSTFVFKLKRNYLL